MVQKVVPTLSSSGFVTNTPEKIDRLMAYFFLSEDSQSTLYAGNITSLPALIQKNNSETFVLEQATRDALTTYLSRYFTGVQVQATTDRPRPGDESRTNLTIYVEFTDNGTVYNLGKMVRIVDSKVSEVINLNNSGDLP